MSLFVVIEYNPVHEGDPNQIPWPDVLKDAVEVKNWQYVNQPVDHDGAMISGMNHCISSHNCENDKVALDLILNAAERNGDVPNEINLCELYEHITRAVDLLDNIEVYARDVIGIYTPLNSKIAQ